MIKPHFPSTTQPALRILEAGLGVQGRWAYNHWPASRSFPFWLAGLSNEVSIHIPARLENTQSPLGCTTQVGLHTPARLEGLPTSYQPASNIRWAYTYWPALRKRKAGWLVWGRWPYFALQALRSYRKHPIRFKPLTSIPCLVPVDPTCSVSVEWGDSVPVEPTCSAGAGNRGPVSLPYIGVGEREDRARSSPSSAPRRRRSSKRWRLSELRDPGTPAAFGRVHLHSFEVN